METMQAGEIVTRTIAYEGDRIDKPRDQRRVLLEVTTESTNGCDVEGHYVPACAVVDGAVVPRTARVEVYADRLRHVMALVRGPKARRALEQARELAQAARQAWLEEEVSDPRARERMRSQPATDGRSANQLEWLMRWRCPVNEYTELHERFPEFKHGLPPLTSVSVVDPRTGRVVADLTDLADVPFELTIDAPPTPATAAKHANEHLAATLSEAIARASGGSAVDEKLAALAKLIEAQNQTIAAQAAQIAELGRSAKTAPRGRAE